MYNRLFKIIFVSIFILGTNNVLAYYKVDIYAPLCKSVCNAYSGEILIPTSHKILEIQKNSKVLFPKDIFNTNGKIKFESLVPGGYTKAKTGDLISSDSKLLLFSILFEGKSLSDLSVVNFYGFLNDGTGTKIKLDDMTLGMYSENNNVKYTWKLDDSITFDIVDSNEIVKTMFVTNRDEQKNFFINSYSGLIDISLFDESNSFFNYYTESKDYFETPKIIYYKSGETFYYNLFMPSSNGHPLKNGILLFFIGILVLGYVIHKHKNKAQ